MNVSCRLSHLLAFVLFTSAGWSQAVPDTLEAVFDHAGRIYLAWHNPAAGDNAGIAPAMASNSDAHGINNDYTVVPPRIYERFDSARFSWFAFAGGVPVIYRVKPKETVFRIARRYFDLPVEALMMTNALRTTELSIGQELVVGWYLAGSAGNAVPEDTKSAPLPPGLLEDPFGGEEPVFHKGTAYWDKSYAHDGHLFAMHRHARQGSYIEVINPMFGTRAAVKVIGTIPETYRSDIDVIVSPGVARQLGVIDSRFYVHLRYLE